MKHKDCQYTTKNRRGLSSIVGSLFFVVLMVSAFSMFGLVLQYQSDMGETARIVANADLKAQQEDFVLNSVQQLAGGFLKVELTNQGQNVAEMFTLVMTNKTDPGEPTKTIRIPSATSFLLPSEDTPTDVVAGFNLKMDIPVALPDETYDFKVISSLGTIKKISITCKQSTGDCGVDTVGPAGPSSLTAQLFLDGPTGINTKTSTVILFVSNNGEVTLTNVRPLMGNPIVGNLCNDMWQPFPTAPAIQIDNVNPCHLDSPTPVVLVPGQSALFKWDGKILGDIDDEVLFCNQVRGVDPTFVDINSAVVCDRLQVIDPNDCGSPDCGPGDDDPLDEKFITRPELFLTIPSPFGGHSFSGDDEDRALWGANVVNPTDTTMYIHKVTITAFPPAANDNFDVIMEGGFAGHDCMPQDISPGIGNVPSPLPDNPASAKRADEAGSWSCPGSNTIMWRDYDNPITLLPQSTFPFLVKLVSDDPITKNAESVLVDSTVYTTSGAFGKGNYQSTVYTDGMYANIFATSDWTDPLNIDNIITSVSNIPSGSEQTFHIVLTDFDTDLGTHINATSKIVVNVPRAFTDVKTVMTESYGLVDIPNAADPTMAQPSVTIHPDDTTQIIATLVNHLGDSANENVVLSFKATAPIVTKDKLMVMYTLANGVGTNDNSVGPLTEIILVVVP